MLKKNDLQMIQGKLFVILGLRITEYTIFGMHHTFTNILNHPSKSIPNPKIASLLTSLNNDDVNKSFQVDSVSEDSLDNLELLRLEVQQLKRENNFLKTKIQELKLGKTQTKIQSGKKQSLNCINILKKNAALQKENHQNDDSLTSIFAEIQNILKSLASVHRLQIDEKLWIKISLIPSDTQYKRKEEVSLTKLNKQKKQKMNKKLSLIGLQKQQTRYQALLELFGEYYRQKMEEQTKIKQKIQKFIENTIEIGKKLIESASFKNSQKSMKSSSIASIKKRFVQNSPSITSLNKENFEPYHLRIKSQRNQIFHSTMQYGRVGSKKLEENREYY